MPFNLGPLTDAENRFRRDFVDFARLWADVKEGWRDDRCRRFEQEHLSSLGPSLNRFTAALHEFTDLVRKADRALADDRHGETEL
jgi:hypothetical protein